MQPHEQWLSRAWDDLQFARLGLEQRYYAQVCFLSQQVIEKCLKGHLVSKRQLYPKTHKLTDLWQLCDEIREELEPFQGLFRVIDGYYLPVRYPDAVPDERGLSFTKERAKEALETAEKVYALIRAKVK